MYEHPSTPSASPAPACRVRIDTVTLHFELRFAYVRARRIQSQTYHTTLLRTPDAIMLHRFSLVSASRRSRSLTPPLPPTRASPLNPRRVFFAGSSQYLDALYCKGIGVSDESIFGFSVQTFTTPSLVRLLSDASAEAPSALLPSPDGGESINRQSKQQPRGILPRTLYFVCVVAELSPVLRNNKKVLPIVSRVGWTYRSRPLTFL